MAVLLSIVGNLRLSNLRILILVLSTSQVLSQVYQDAAYYDPRYSSFATNVAPASRVDLSQQNDQRGRTHVSQTTQRTVSAQRKDSSERVVFKDDLSTYEQPESKPAYAEGQRRPQAAQASFGQGVPEQGQSSNQFVGGSTQFERTPVQYDKDPTQQSQRRPQTDQVTFAQGVPQQGQSSNQFVGGSTQFEQAPVRYDQRPTQHAQSPTRHRQNSPQHSQNPTQYDQGSSQHSQNPSQHGQGSIQGGQDSAQHGQAPNHNGQTFDQNSQNRNFDALIDFSLRMTKEIVRQDPGNTVISPVSLSTLLALLAQGADSDTLYELEAVLGLNKLDARNTYGDFVTRLQKSSTRDILFENAVFVGNGVLNPKFKAYAGQNFKATVDKSDFSRPRVAANQINSWISENTKQRITDIISPDLIDATTQCVLVNAAFFKNVWKTKFDPRKTTSQKFSIAPNRKVDANFMRVTSTFPCNEDKNMGAKWVILPFAESDFSMVFVLPTEQNGLDRLMDGLTTENLRTIFNTTEEHTTVLAVPKFKIEYTTSLVPVLKKMHLSKIFTSQSSLRSILQDHPIRISGAVQKAVITVDENGATAAAATVLAVNTLSLATYYDEFHFTADQPFLAFIINKDLVPIFVSKISDPSLAA